MFSQLTLDLKDISLFLHALQPIIIEMNGIKDILRKGNFLSRRNVVKSCLSAIFNV